MIETRHAVRPDLEQMSLFDDAIGSDANRSEEIQAAVDRGTCWIAGQAGALQGYIVLKPKSFFHYDFVSLVFVRPSARRLGIATALFDVVEAASETEKLFTSTNVSNHKMRALLLGRGYTQVGEVRDLDPGDPELFFVKPSTDPHSVSAG